MRRNTRARTPRALAALVASLLVALVLSACGDDEEAGDVGGGSDGSETAAGPTSKCGLGNGQEATGEPIRLGAIVTKQPGVDFTDITDMAGAYFECVNDNGGIDGRPVRYIVETEQTNPQQVRSLATKLLENENALGLVGSTSLLDCAVNHELYERRDIYAIVAGVPRDCFFTSNIAPVNMGPYYSTIGAAQYLVRQGAKSIVAVTNDGPGAEFNNRGAVELAEREGLPSRSFLETVPITSGAGVAQRLVQAAGEGGGVILDFVPPEALKVLQGAEQQGLIDEVMWACATPCNDASIAEALGPQWDGKLGINAELNLIDTNGPDMRLYRQVTEEYSPDTPLGSFGQMGFLAARIATQALLDVEGEFTRESVNDAFEDVRNFETDLLCKPWYFGPGDEHVPNNTDWTIVPRGGEFVKEEDCFEIAALPSNPLEEIREREQELLAEE